MTKKKLSLDKFVPKKPLIEQSNQLENKQLKQPPAPLKNTNLNSKTQQTEIKQNKKPDKPVVVFYSFEEFSDIKNLLNEMQVSKNLISELSKKHEPMQIKEYVRYTHNRWQANKVKNPGGFLRKAITEQYDLSEQRQTEIKQKETQEKQRRIENRKHLAAEQQRQEEEKEAAIMAEVEKKLAQLPENELKLLWKKADKEFRGMSSFIKESYIQGIIRERLLNELSLDNAKAPQK